MISSIDCPTYSDCYRWLYPFDNLFVATMLWCVLPIALLQFGKDSVDNNLDYFIITCMFLACILIVGVWMYYTDEKYNTDVILGIPFGCVNWKIWLLPPQTKPESERWIMMLILGTAMSFVLLMKRGIDNGKLLSWHNYLSPSNKDETTAAVDEFKRSMALAKEMRTFLESMAKCGKFHSSLWLRITYREYTENKHKPVQLRKLVKVANTRREVLKGVDEDCFSESIQNLLSK